MDQEERLKYCKLCQNKSFDFQQGLLCKLTSAKPSFEENCESYQEDPIERKNYETNLYYEMPRSTGIFEGNSHSSSNWLNSIITPYLPYKLKVYKVNLFQLILIPLFTLLILSLTSNHIILFILTLVTGGALSVFSFKNTMKNPEIILELDGVSIKTSNLNVYWSDVTLTYIHSNLNSNSLMVETLSNNEPIKIKIDDSYGPFIIQTLVELYREKNSNKV